MLRKTGVVGKFVEFFGEGLSELPLADRATIANMAPEYGATCGIFPVDLETLRYLRMTGRTDEQVALVEAYCKEQGLFHTKASPHATYSEMVELDLASVEPSVAGPRRPQDRVPLSQTAENFKHALPTLLGPAAAKAAARQVMRWEGEGGNPTATGAEGNKPDVAEAVSTKHHIDVSQYLDHGSVVIAAITSCTNTSNPYVMIAAGLLAKHAVERGLSTAPWVKTSVAPGSRVVTEYYKKAGLMEFLDKLRFSIAGYGCTTCIGNSGPLPADVSKAIDDHQLVVASVLSGNRNFEGRINSEVRANYLMSPPLVVAYALAGRIDHDLLTEPLGKDRKGKPVYLRDLWPSQQEVDEVVRKCIDSQMFRRNYASISEGDEHWKKLKVPKGDTYAWEKDSTYIKKAPYFDDMPAHPLPVRDIVGARVLAWLGDSVTTDHISPAGSIKQTSPAGKYLIEHGVNPHDFNSYGSRRGNHEVMVRGTFANVRLRNKLAPGTEGGVTRYLPTNQVISIFDASMKYQADGVPLIVLAGKEYGSGSSRDWAAKGPKLLGVQAVIAQSYERIHRSNLVGMGILPLQFLSEEDPETLGLTGEETYNITGLREMLDAKFASGRHVPVTATRSDGTQMQFEATVRIDTPQEILYYQHGGILQFVLRQLLAGWEKPKIVSRGMSTVADPSTGSSIT
jgi:aconitate hydratase